MKPTLALIVLVLGSGLAASCGGGAHLSDNFGRRTRATFALQHVSDEVVMEAPAGLDSEEAAAIQASHRASLGAAPAARATSDASTRVMVLEEPARASRK